MAAGAGSQRLPFRHVAFLGLGLIGGSIALALRRADPEIRLSAWTPDGHGPSVALASGLLDAAPREPPTTMEAADLVILAGPPLAILDHLDRLAGEWRAALGGALVTDVASTKLAIARRAADRHVRFVGGHPMAGREASGIEAADARLFEGRPWPVVASSDSDERDIETVAALARATGANPLAMSATVHDAAVATVSHVPLLAAAALVEAMTADPAWHDGRAAELAASGWRDTTRIAAGSPAMGAGIVATNGREILPRVRALRAALDAWIAELERPGGPDPDRVEARLEAAREQRRKPGS